jgi:prepilin peptidase CpaA
MTTSNLLMAVPLVAGMLLAALIDGAVRRIPNWLVFPMLAAGFFQSFLPTHAAGPLQSLLGFLTGFGLTFAMFALGAIRGGDVKLFAAIGAFLGPQMTLFIFLAETVIGMVIVLVQAAGQGRLKVLARNSAVLAVNLAHVGDVGLDHATQTGQSCRSVDRPLPFAVPTLIATILILGLKWSGGLI